MEKRKLSAIALAGALLLSLASCGKTAQAASESSGGGFLDLSAYGDKYQYSANVGILDIVDALERVWDNIEAFGGDPDNYVFHNLEADAAEKQKALADQVSQAWVSFARSGVPGAGGLPEWEPYTREGGATMILDTESRLANHHDQALMSLLAPDYIY